MDTKVAEGGRRSSIVVACSVGLLYAVPAVRAELVFDPRFTVGVAHTDNVALVPTDEAAETVYEVLPGFNLSQDSARITTDTAYRLEAYYYREQRDSSVYHLLDSDSSLALDPGNIYLRFGVGRRQSIRDPAAPLPPGGLLSVSANRVERDDAYIGPTFQYAIGSNVVVNASFQRAFVRYDDEPAPPGAPPRRVRDSDDDTASFSINNYERGRGLSWSVAYSDIKTEYEGFAPYEYRQATLELGGWVGSALRLFAAGGKESPWDDPLEASLEDSFWEAGLSMGVGESFNAELAAGERSFGSSLRASFGMTLPRGSTELSYSEQPTTESRNPYDSGGLLEPDEPDDGLSAAGQPERFLSKRLQWRLGIDARRFGYTVSVYDETREDRTLTDGTLALDDQQQKGVSFSTSWTPGQRTRFSLRLSRAERQPNADETREQRLAGITAGYNFGRSTQLSLNFDHQVEEPVAGTAGSGYRVNILSVLFTRSF